MKAIGWLKILGYVCSLAALGLGFVNPKIAIMIMGIISILAKAAEEYVKLTASTADDELVKKIIDKLKESGLIKV